MEADGPDFAFSWRVEPMRVVRRVAKKFKDESYQFDARISIHFTADQALLRMVSIRFK
jgi:hypothetical protein